MRVPLVLLATGALLAGCLQDAAPAEVETASTGGVVIDETREAASYQADLEIVGEAVGPDLNATLEAPPRLIPGEWWRIEFDTGLDERPTMVRIVAEVTDEGYVFGMPHEGWYKEAISFHAPALGDVAFDLSYATHNEVFQPVRFPLTQGDTWETLFATQPLVATVEKVEGTRATVAFTAPPSDPQPTDPLFAVLFGAGDGEAMRLVYDAQQHEVVELTSGIGTYRVVEHGYGYEGWVTIPRGEHTAIDYGQFSPFLEPSFTREIEVGGGYNRLTLMQVVFPLTPGLYRTRALAPDGTEFVTESRPGDGFVIAFHEAADPDGTWQHEDLVAGVGGTYNMGIAYHQYDIRLPDGAKRSDHSHEVIR